MKILKNILLLAILASIVFFCVINRQIINIHLLPKKIDIELPLFVLIIINFFLGFFICKFLSIGRNIKNKLEIRSFRKKIESLQNELEIKTFNLDKFSDQNQRME